MPLRRLLASLHAPGNPRRFAILWQLAVLSAFGFCLAVPVKLSAQTLASTPPMGWNDWAHYQCNFNAQTIVNNARALKHSGLAAAGYNTVTIDDCWMSKDRDARGDLQVDPQRFPQGMKPVADAVHALGLKFGIYEDSGYATCGGFAGSGEINGGGRDYFAQDAKLFASWGVDYLKLDGCNLYVPKPGQDAEIYRRAYAAEHRALQATPRPIVFSESAPAYFQGTPDWYDVLRWVKPYGQLWREGSDVATFDLKAPDKSRFHSVLWNYSYNLPLGRFQQPGNWNDADFIIAGDRGMTQPESRSQMALWAMMSAPLILSSDLSKLSPAALAILDNRRIVAIDQDAKGAMATLVRRDAHSDLLFKPLSGGDAAVAVLNRGESPLPIALHPADLGWAAASGCTWLASDLWTGKGTGSKAGGNTVLEATVAAHDTAIWRVHPSSSCGSAARFGTVTRLTTGKHRDAGNYTLCLAAPGAAGACTGAPAEAWIVGSDGSLQSAGQCLTAGPGKAHMQLCAAGMAQQRWKYTLAGNLVSSQGQCLSSSDTQQTGMPPQAVSLRACGHNLPGQIWSLPN